VTVNISQFRYLHLLKGFPALSSKSFKGVVPDPAVDFFDYTFKVTQDDARAFKSSITANSKLYSKSDQLWRDEYGSNYHQDLIFRRDLLDVEKDISSFTLSKLGLSLDIIEEMFSIIGSALVFKDVSKSAALVDRITSKDFDDYNEYLFLPSLVD
jgi:hypothetical protein